MDDRKSGSMALLSNVKDVVMTIGSADQASLSGLAGKPSCSVTHTHSF